MATKPTPAHAVNATRNINENEKLIAQSSTADGEGSNSASAVPNGTSSVFVCVLNMIKLMVGSGMLSLPWAFAHVGLYPGILACMFCATFNFISAMFLIYSAEITQVFEYSALLSRLGVVWEYASALCLLYVVSGSLLGYLILIGDFVNDAIQQMGAAPDAIPAQRELIIVLFTVCLLTPLVLLKDLTALRYSSFVGIAAIFYCVVLLIVTAMTHVRTPGFELGSAYDGTSTFEQSNWNTGFFIVTNVCTQAFVCHYSVTRVYLNMKDRTIRKMWVANAVSYAVVCFIYLVFGICGYVLYGSRCTSDVLVSFVGGVSVGVARIAMTLSVCGTYPLAFVACQATLQNKFFSTANNPVWNYDAKPWLRTAVILCTQAVYLVLSCLIPTIGPVVSVNGAMSTIGLISLFPIAASWRIGFAVQGQSEETTRINTVAHTAGYQSVETNHEPGGPSVDMHVGKRSLPTKIGLSVMLVVGVVFGALGFIFEFKELGQKGAH